ncbi:MAG: PTS sugar transporter subunit IIB [Candidatus Schekmanbacteria bacterium]|nr:PTS sugar transporter subunit IIB [Candidatus Schekmanbacteria bacterium]
MSIVLIRIDDRLVHGQVVEGWVKYLSATKVVVVNDLIAKNYSRQMVMKFALPEGVEFQAVSVAQIAQRGDLALDKEQREIILFSSPGDVVAAIDQGLHLGQINLGGMHHFNSIRCLTTNIALTKQDVDDLKSLLNKGIIINVCALPKDQGIDLINLL